MSKESSIKIHPTAMAFPALDAKSMKELRADIEANGIRVPLLFNKDESVLIDGRNRWYIAHDLGIEKKDMPIEHYKGKEEDIPSVIISRNLIRRHLNDKQRAALVTKLLAPAMEKEAKARRDTAPTKGGAFKKDNGEKGRTVEKLAAAGKTSRSKIEQSMTVRKSGGDAALDDIIAGKADLTKKAKAASDTRKKTRKPKKILTFEEVLWRKWSAFLQRFGPSERRKVKDTIGKWLKNGDPKPF